MGSSPHFTGQLSPLLATQQPLLAQRRQIAVHKLLGDHGDARVLALALDHLFEMAAYLGDQFWTVLLDLDQGHGVFLDFAAVESKASCDGFMITFC